MSSQFFQSANTRNTYSAEDDNEKPFEQVSGVLDKTISTLRNVSQAGQQLLASLKTKPGITPEYIENYEKIISSAAEKRDQCLDLEHALEGLHHNVEKPAGGK